MPPHNPDTSADLVRSVRGNRAVRLRACWILLIAAIAVTGCSSSSKRPGGRSASNDAPVPPIPANPTPVGNTAVVKGLLAGQVKDKFNREVSKASIQLVEL